MPVKYIGSTAPLIVLYGVSHWPRKNVPHRPLSPRALLREASELLPASTAIADSTWKNAARSGLILSVPRKPRLEEFCVTRVRDATSTPVGLMPSEPRGNVAAAAAPRADTLSTSTLKVP